MRLGRILGRDRPGRWRSGLRIKRNIRSPIGSSAGVHTQNTKSCKIRGDGQGSTSAPVHSVRPAAKDLKLKTAARRTTPDYQAAAARRGRADRRRRRSPDISSCHGHLSFHQSAPVSSETSQWITVSHAPHGDMRPRRARGFRLLPVAWQGNLVRHTDPDALETPSLSAVCSDPRTTAAAVFPAAV